MKIKEIKYDPTCPAGRISKGEFDQNTSYGKVVFWSKNVTLAKGKSYCGEFKLIEPTNSKVAFLEPTNIVCLNDIPAIIEINRYCYNNRPRIVINQFQFENNKTLFSYCWGSSLEIPKEYSDLINWTEEEVLAGIEWGSYLSEFDSWCKNPTGVISPDHIHIDYINRDGEIYINVNLYDKEEYSYLKIKGKEILNELGYINEKKVNSIRIDPTITTQEWFEISRTISYTDCGEDTWKYEGVDCTREDHYLSLQKVKRIRFEFDHAIVDSLIAKGYKIAYSDAYCVNYLYNGGYHIITDTIVTVSEYSDDTFNRLIKAIVKSDYKYLLQFPINQYHFSKGQNRGLFQTSFYIVWTPDIKSIRFNSRLDKADISCILTPAGFENYSINYDIHSEYFYCIDINQNLIEAEKEHIEEIKAKEEKEIADQRNTVWQNILKIVTQEFRVAYFGQEIANDWWEFLEGCEDSENEETHEKIHNMELAIRAETTKRVDLLINN